MPGSLTWSLKASGAATLVTLEGSFSEDSDFHTLLKQLSGAITFDLKGVRGINSCGVREWIRFITELSRKDGELALEQCSASFVLAMSQISNFIGKASVRSILAPYFCPACERSRTRLLEVSAQALTQLEATLPCECGQRMELDDLPEPYHRVLHPRASQAPS